MKYQYVVLLCM